MSKNTVVRGMLVPSLKNKPLDGRQLVPTLGDIVNIENPHVGFLFYVESEGRWYEVVSLTDRIIDELTIPNDMVDEYKEFGKGMSEAEKEEYLTKKLATQLYLNKEDAALEYLKKTDADKDFLKKVQAELEFLKKEEAKELYQPKGNYQPAGDYSTNERVDEIEKTIGNNGLFNLTEYTKKYYQTDSDAIQDIPSTQIKLGLIIMYAVYDNTESDILQWRILQFVGDSVELFTTASKWVRRDVYANDGYRYAGLLSPSDTPSILRSKVYYIASTEGAYINCGNIVVDENEIAILKYTPKTLESGIWEKDVLTVNSSLSSIAVEVSEKLELVPGTISETTGNIWSMQDKTRNDNPQQYFWSGFVLLSLIKVKKGDTIVLDYESMGIDINIYTLGVIYCDSEYKAIYQNTYSSYVLWQEESYKERTIGNASFIKIVLHQKNKSSVLQKKESYFINVRFTAYHADNLEFVKEPISLNPSANIEYPLIKPVSYTVLIQENGITDIVATETYKGNTIGYNNGVVLIPEDYSPEGKKIPLIIFLHGTGGFDFSSPTASSESYLPLLKNVSKGGYLVAYCSTLSSLNYNNDMGTTKTIRDANFPEPTAWECYHKLYKHLVRRYNIDEDRVYAFAKSAGGMNMIMLSHLGVIPIKAIGGLAASTDLITNLKVLGQANTTANPFLHRIGLTDANVSDKLNNVSADTNYLKANKEKLIGLNPLWLNNIGLDKDVQIERCIANVLDSSVIEEDNVLQTAIEKSCIISNKPMKWWHAVDDVNVPIAYTRIYQKMVKNGGGIFIIREFPEGLGAHNAVDSAENAPTTEYTHDNGVTVTLPTAYAEVLEWFKKCS